MFIQETSRFQIHLVVTRMIHRAGDSGIQVKIITTDHLAIAKESCRVTGVE